MNREEIIGAIQEYIRDDKAKYAVMIDGAWGTGKTFLYKNKLIDVINGIEYGKTERRENAYISLYGVSTIEALSKQVLSCYYLAPKDETGKKAVKVLQGVIGIASKAVSLSVTPVSISLDQLTSGIVDMVSIGKMVICFDDLERCTIPLNELFGFINNLVEHCECKVIILADETNMGKIYANTKLEEKYLAVLSGRRIGKPKSEKSESNGTGDNSLITISELKRLNERVFSENYIYKDIKEKVIGKTFYYYPQITEIIKELIIDWYADEADPYRNFLENHIDLIVSNFILLNTRNIRIINSWIPLFKKIFNSFDRMFSKSKYSSTILEDFLRYSIWVACAEKNNKKLLRRGNNLTVEYVYMEDNEYNHILRHAFIDDWINKHAWDDADFVKAVRSIESRCEREELTDPKRRNSTGKAMAELYGWRFCRDSEVQKLIKKLIAELKEGKYEYCDFSNIISFLLLFEKIGLFRESLHEVQMIMLAQIDKYSECRLDDEMPKTFDTEEMTKRYREIYDPIRKAMEQKNKHISISDAEERKIYSSGKVFKEYCENREDYFCRHKSFFDYVELESLKTLISASDLKGLYEIKTGLSKVYHMGNVRDFYASDTDKLKDLHGWLIEQIDGFKMEITRTLALRQIDGFVESVLQRLDY